MKDFEAHGVEQHVNTKVKEIRDNVIYAENTQEGTECTIHADTIVNALGSKKNVWDGKEITVPLTLIGDCAGERTAGIAAAIRIGYHAANEI